MYKRQAPNPSPLNETSSDPFTYHIKPPTFTAFLGFLKSTKLKYTHYVSRRHCSKCAQGQLAAKLIELEDTKLAQMAANGEKGSQAFKDTKKKKTCTKTTSPNTLHTSNTWKRLVSMRTNAVIA